MEKVKLAISGLGQRGYSMIDVILSIDDFDVVAVCDKYQDRIDRAIEKIKEKRGNTAKGYTNYSDMLADKDITAVYVATDWEIHINQAIEAMEKGVPVGMEVGGAYSLKDCWRLVKAYEKTSTPIMMMENCCFDRFELLSTNLARKGLLGTVCYCHGQYSHDLRKEILGGNINRHYRLRNYMSRNCENYPTHELGPIAKLLNINKGNRMVSISSNASKACGLHEFTFTEENPDKSLKGQKFKQGDIVITTIKCENGELITLKLDTTLPTFYNRDFTVKGTKGMTTQAEDAVLIDGKFSEAWQPDPTKFFAEYRNNTGKDYSEYLPKYWQNITEVQKATGHGGMDLLMLRKWAECLIKGLPMPIDVYDAAAWYAITPLSAKSIAKNGKTIRIPDFTKGKYKNTKPSDVIDFDKD